jgi:hypothetical protein
LTEQLRSAQHALGTVRAECAGLQHHKHALTQANATLRSQLEAYAAADPALPPVTRTTTKFNVQIASNAANAAAAAAAPATATAAAGSNKPKKQASAAAANSLFIHRKAKPAAAAPRALSASAKRPASASARRATTAPAGTASTSTATYRASIPLPFAVGVAGATSFSLPANAQQLLAKDVVLGHSVLHHTVVSAGGGSAEPPVAPPPPTANQIHTPQLRDIQNELRGGGGAAPALSAGAGAGAGAGVEGGVSVTAELARSTGLCAHHNSLQSRLM